MLQTQLINNHQTYKLAGYSCYISKFKSTLLTLMNSYITLVHLIILGAQASTSVYILLWCVYVQPPFQLWTMCCVKSLSKWLNVER